MHLSMLLLNQKRKFIIANALFIIIVFIATATIIWSIRGDNRLLTRDAVKSVLHQSYSTYTQWLDRYQASNRALSKSKRIRQLIESVVQPQGDHDTQALSTELRTAVENRTINGYEVIDMNGAILATSGRIDESVSNIAKLFPERFKRAMRGEHLIMPPCLAERGSIHYQSDAITQGYVVYFLSPVFDEQQSVIALFASVVSVDKDLSNLVASARLGDTGETYLLNEHGMMLSKSRYQTDLMQRGLLQPNQTSTGRIQVRNPGPENDMGLSHDNIDEFPLTLMASSIANKKSGYSMTGYEDYRGVPVFGAWLWDERSGVGIATEIDIQESTKPFKKMVTAILIMVALLTSAALFMIYLISGAQQAKEKHLLYVQNKLQKKINERTHDLESALKKLRKQATTDSLTKLLNRRAFEENFQKAWLVCKRDKKALGIIMLDVDFFKQYNDHYGHQAGDSCLSSMAAALNSTDLLNRPLDLVARYGGEEFIVLLTDTNQDYVHHVAETLRERVEDLCIPHEHRTDGKPHCTISLGVASITPTSHDTPEQLIKRADQALYSAKRTGRNKTVMDKKPTERRNFALIEPNKRNEGH